MEKSELYYLVQKGTNIKTTSRLTKEVIIVEADSINRVAENWPECEKITIEEYEGKFESAADGDESGKD